MNIPNSQAPKKWSETELATEAQKSLEAFVDRRLQEPEGKYATQVRARRKSVIRLFKILTGVDPKKADPEVVRTILLDEDLFAALRYVAAPPVSEDDLGVLVTRKIMRVKKADIKGSDQLTLKVLTLLCRLADPFRFPWIAANRKPSPREIRAAVQMTTILHASQALQTERRGYGKIVEGRLEKRLTDLGFNKVSSPNGAMITAPKFYPVYPNFYGECTVHGRKVDLFIPLQTGRMIALEAKDSSSGLNSVKRLNNDTAAKAKHFAEQAGKIIVNVALLSGVFKVTSLVSAQDAGLYLVWAHDMDDFIEWVKAQT